MRPGAHRPSPVEGSSPGEGLYERIYELVNLIPAGKVATYGQIAALVGGCTPRMAGYAMAAVPFFRPIPWQRVINSRGEVSPRRHGEGQRAQREILEAEGVCFDARGRIDLATYQWAGPPSRWWKRKETEGERDAR